MAHERLSLVQHKQYEVICTSYDIPDEVKYREKIVFGLDLKQLCYFCVFTVLAFLSLNLPLEGEAKLILPSLFSILGAGFIFLNLEERALDAWHYYSGVRKASPSDPKAQRLVGIKAIENGQITLLDGSLRAILKVEPINFSLLDEGQKAAFVSNYREFLNHLTDPIQILVRTEKCDAEEAFSDAQLKMKGAQQETAAIFRDFFTYEREFMESKKVRGRKYYLIATQYSIGTPEEGRAQLEQKVQIIQEKLSSCGLRSERLGNGALTHLFSSYSMPTDKEQKQDEPKKGKSIFNALFHPMGIAKGNSSAGIRSPTLHQNPFANPLEPLLAKIRKSIEPSLNSIIWFFIKAKIDISAIFYPVQMPKKQKKPREPAINADPFASIESVAWIRIAKKEPEKSTIKSLTPDFDISSNCAKVNGICHRIIKTTGYPRKVEDGWLESFMATSEPYDVTLHIHPASISSTLANIHNQIIKQTSDLYAGNAENTPNPSLEIKRKDTMKVYGLLYKGKEKMFNVSLYVDSQADSKDELGLMAKRCRANMNALLIVPKDTDYRMADGIKSMLPIGVDALGAQREFLTSSLCATFPFLYPVDSRMEGTFFAHERKTLNPIFIDFDSMSNKHFFVLGISGSGKSYAAKFLLMQHVLAREAKIYILDPNAEYSNLVQQLGGTEIVLSKDSDKIINLFDLAGEDFGSKMLTLISVFDIITGGLTESQKGALNEALVRVYKKKGIIASNPASWARNAPTFSDLKAVLEDMRRLTARRIRSQDEKSVEVLLNRVRMYARGGFFGFLDRGTRVDLKNKLLDFNLSGLPPQVRQLVMFSVLELISREMRKDKKPKVVLIDEGWSLLRSKEAENYILEFIKTSRKYNASIGFITQEIEDLMRSEGGRSILNTTSTKILLRQNSSNLELISKTLALNERERDYLLRAEKGQGLMMSEQGRYEFMVRAPPLIHALITTDPNDKMAEKAPAKKEEVQEEEPEEYEGHGYYHEKEVDEDEQSRLISRGYVHHNSLLLGACGSHKLLVKRQPQESPEHSLLVWAIADEMLKHGGKPKVQATVGADVTARIGKRTVCFEVETGENLECHGKEHVREKMEERKRECDTLIVVVTDRRLKDTYAGIARAKAITRTEVEGTVAGMFK
ncbi:MAG: ATP-binding protein [Candidatus Micrarchaeota archaeon]|nr:ATP-binding protein [Candidatus Micrarchaeota archaeon]